MVLQEQDHSDDDDGQHPPLVLNLSSQKQGVHGNCPGNTHSI